MTSAPCLDRDDTYPHPRLACSDTCPPCVDRGDPHLACGDTCPPCVDRGDPHLACGDTCPLCVDRGDPHLACGDTCPLCVDRGDPHLACGDTCSPCVDRGDSHLACGDTCPLCVDRGDFHLACGDTCTPCVDRGDSHLACGDICLPCVDRGDRESPDGSGGSRKSSVSSQSSEKKAYVNHDDAECCPRCGRRVYFAEQVLCLARKWHKSCFSCGEPPGWGERSRGGRAIATSVSAGVKQFSSYWFLLCSYFEVPLIIHVVVGTTIDLDYMDC